MRRLDFEDASRTLFRCVKTSVTSKFSLLLVLIVLLSFSACSGMLDPDENSQTGGNNIEKGRIACKFSPEDYRRTRSVCQLPDTSEFYVLIRKESASEKEAEQVVFNGKYKDLPSVIEVEPGDYYIQAYSVEFNRPKFSCPVYGDRLVLTVDAHKTSRVVLDCRMINACVRLKIPRSFLTSFPEAVLFLRSEDGNLMYSYRERRYAYFNPGRVELVMVNSESEKVLTVRNIKPREALTIGLDIAKSKKNISAEVLEVKDALGDLSIDDSVYPNEPSQDESGQEEDNEGGILDIEIHVDTDVIETYTSVKLSGGESEVSDDGGGSSWNNDKDDNSEEDKPNKDKPNKDKPGKGGDSGGDKNKDPEKGFSNKDLEQALSVFQARASVGTEQVWVYGYIVGGDLTSSRIKFAPPFKSVSNLAIAASAEETAQSACMSIQVPKGKVRDLLNLVEHPVNLGHKVYLRGDVVQSYYGRIGLKNIKKVFLSQ